MQASSGTGVPLCDLQTQQMALRPDIDKAVGRVLASGQFILGPEVKAFEEEVAAYCGAGYGVGCASGTDALLLALHALDIGPGDEVIMPPFTFFATAGSVSRTGARPVFADIDPQTFNLDPMQVENKITSRTRAIMVVHLFGQCADMEALWRSCRAAQFADHRRRRPIVRGRISEQTSGNAGRLWLFQLLP